MFIYLFFPLPPHTPALLVDVLVAVVVVVAGAGFIFHTAAGMHQNLPSIFLAKLPLC